MNLDLWAIDTSVGVPLLSVSHPLHIMTDNAVGNRRVHFSGHAYFETYSVLTRFPGDARVPPFDAVRLMTVGFGKPLLLSIETSSRAPTIFAKLGITGGEVYDGLVALAAKENRAVLITRDTRAMAIYDAIGVEIEIVTS